MLRPPRRPDNDHGDTATCPAAVHPLVAAMHTVTGAPALVIILVVLALLVLGVISLIRFIARRARH